MKKKSNLNSNFLLEKGYEVIKIPTSLKKSITKSIIKMLNEKVKCHDKNIGNIKKLNNFTNPVLSLNDAQFRNEFGHVAKRFLDFQTSQRINSWVKKNINKKLNAKFASLVYPSKYERKINKKIKAKQFDCYFRCVRPNFNNDVGTPHRDSGFWNVLPTNDQHKAPIKYKKLYKIWIPIHGCNKKNSLRIISESHRDKNIKTKYITKNNRKKPFIELKKIKNLKKRIIQPISNFNNEAILFTDNSVHFAPPNLGANKLRISTEFTVVTE